jgi:tRNA-dihydrouridine synthase
MIARGSFGQPWIFNQARALLEGHAMPPAPPVEARFSIALDHARMVQGYEADPEGAALEFRKHLGWYVRGLPNSADLRRRLHQVNSFAEVEGIFAEYLARGQRFAESEPDAADMDDAAQREAELLEAEHA